MALIVPSKRDFQELFWVKSCAGEGASWTTDPVNSFREIVAMEAVLKSYIYEAIEVEKAGLKVELKKHSDYVIPEELRKKLDEMPALKKAFDALTPGRQRGYMFHISAPKQSKTRESRVEKCIQLILDGKGFND